VELNERLQCGENVRREVTRETADGLRHFILHVVPIRLDAENVSGYAIYTDVTERREREAALRRQNERLDEFASIVSHDLRNPLSVAEGYVTLANETGEIAHLEKTLEALDRMDELVGDLLSLARQGEAVGETEPVSIEAIARDAWESVDTDGIELVVDGDVTIDASPTRTRELLENVFRNSVEHGRRSSGGNDGGDGKPLTVRVGDTAFRGDDGTTGSGFFVEDNGLGSPRASATACSRADSRPRRAGPASGLAITKRIADAHDWQVRAHRRVRRGAVRVQNVVTAAAPPEETDPTDSAPPTAPVRNDLTPRARLSGIWSRTSSIPRTSTPTDRGRKGVVSRWISRSRSRRSTRSRRQSNRLGTTR